MGSMCRYDKAALKAAIANDPEFRFCLSTVCSSGQLHAAGADEPIFRCEACGHRHCVVCEVPWHEGELCVNMQAKKRDEAESAKKVAEISKQCPNCNIKIEKNYGCDHMTCKPHSDRVRCGFVS